MGESRALCSVESATRSCFQGVSATQMSLGAVGRQVCWPSKWQTRTPHSIPDNLHEKADLPLTFHRTNFSAELTETEPGKKRKIQFHLYWRPMSYLAAHRSMPLFSRCWAQQSRKRNSYLGCSLSLPSSSGSQPATGCQPLQWSLTPSGVESAGTSQSQDWGTVIHQHYTHNHSPNGSSVGAVGLQVLFAVRLTHLELGGFFPGQ